MRTQSAALGRDRNDRQAHRLRPAPRTGHLSLSSLRTSGHPTRRRAWAATNSAIAIAVGSSSSKTARKSGSSNSQRSTTFAGIDISATPIRLYRSDATYDLSFDSQWASFDADPRHDVTLDVDGERWTTARWNGDTPEGRHRAVTDSFTLGGSPTGTARLVIAGLPVPVTFSWKIREQ